MLDPIAKSRKLLHETTHIQLRKDGACIVDGKIYRYILRGDTVSDVINKKTGAVLGTACIRFDTSNWVPKYDKMIAEYLLIKNDEERYLRTANLSFGRRDMLRDILLDMLIVGLVGLAVWCLAVSLFHMFH